jgi:hypothetical protein
VRAGLLLLQLPSGPEWVGCERVRRRFCDCYNWEAVLDVSCWVYILVYPQGCDVCNHLSLFLCVADYDKLLPGMPQSPDAGVWKFSDISDVMWSSCLFGVLGASLDVAIP